MVLSQLPIESFPAWARLQDVAFDGVCIKDVAGKGYGLLAERAFESNETGQVGPAILRIPSDLVLSSTAVDNYAKVDQNFNALLEAFGPQSERFKILLYLFAHLISARNGVEGTRRCVATPWSEYIKFLPHHIPVPTMWTEPNRLFLHGTSLENALDAKLAALETEFDQLKEMSSSIPFWNSLFWEHESATIADWILVDAWYRSRCLELPHAGNAMVPALDMINHSAAAGAYYDEDSEGTVSLHIRPGISVPESEEICISYGESKPAAEMLFSYGFIDEDSPSQQLTLPVEPFPDDPLAKAKLRVFNGPPTVTFVLDGTECHWDSPFAHLMCLNEEDGLEFRILQDPTGERQLRLFWQEDDVTDDAGSFEDLTDGHDLQALFTLRVVAMLQELVATQIARLGSAPDATELRPLFDAEIKQRDFLESAAILKRKETGLLAAAASTLEDQKLKLLEDETVIAYLGSREESENEQASTPPTNEDVDFS